MALWVFGYGSLLWNPGFEPAQQTRAVLRDYHRSFCMLSIHHRGSENQPGLVLALDAIKGAQCTGVAFQVKPQEEAQVLAALRERELISSAYVEHDVTLSLEGGNDVLALAYVIDPAHAQYCQLDLEVQAQMIARAVGRRGPNPEYLYNTASHLDMMNIRDDDMAWLVTRVKAIANG